MDYIARIKQIKNEKKITNEKLSELTGIPLSTVSKILAGISDSPKLSNMVLIARARDCTLDYIVSGTPQNNNNYMLSLEEIDFIETYRQLDGYGKDLVSLVAQKELDRVGMISDDSSVRAESVEMAEEIIKLGMYIGVGGVITFKNAKKLPDVVKIIPDELLLVETDCPYLTPHPHRGERNDSGYLHLTLAKAAELRGVSPDTLAKQTLNNTARLFTKCGLKDVL